MKKTRLILNIVVFCLLIASLSIAFVVMPDNAISKAERRPLKQFDEVADAENPFNEIEGYYLDQFPLRDSFRTLKAFLFTKVFFKNDNNEIYEMDSTVVKIENTLDEGQVKYAAENVNKVIDRLLAGCNVYYSIVPDKHYYASLKNGYPAMDYEKLFSIMHETVEGAEYIDITDMLELSDYYKTDSHWSQDKILDVSNRLTDTMQSGAKIPYDGLSENRLTPFYGVYYGQSALSLSPDDIVYLTSGMTENMTMTVYSDTGKTQKYPVYTTDMFKNVDPYDVFCAGAQPLIVIDNPESKSDRELVLFRDSFGSSIAPLLAHSYSKVTLVDLRYMVPDFISNFVKFSENTDVLFLYSTGLLNGGRVLKDFMR